MRARLLTSAVLACLAAGCGEAVVPARGQSARAALLEAPEQLELLPVSVRQDLFRSVVRTSAAEAAGADADRLALFPVIQNGELRAAPGLDPRTDLFQSPDAGEAVSLSLEAAGGDGWPDERRDSLGGLSEREAAELVGRTLLLRWGIHPHGMVEVDRVAGAPYAAAYVDGVLRINPALLYLATAATASGEPR